MALSRAWTLRLAKVKPFRELLRQAGVNSGALAATTLWQEALKMMNASQREVPVRWGVLRSTGHVNAPVKRGQTGIEVTMSYGGPAAPYAWIQHEKRSLRHDSPTKAKYLEDPVMARAADFEQALARRMAFLFRTSAVLGSAWPMEDWRGPAPRRTPRRRQSPRRGGS